MAHRFSAVESTRGVGVAAVCVDYTFVDGYQHDHCMRTVTDCVGCTSPEAHQASVNAMEYLQEGALWSAEEIIAGLTNRKAAA